MILRDYNINDNFAASQSKYISTGDSGTAITRYDGPYGIYNIEIDYFEDAYSTYNIYINGEEIDQWETTLISRGVTTGDGSDEARYNNIKSWISISANLGYVPNTRTIKAISLKPGDEIKIEGSSNNEKGAKLDKLQVIEFSGNGWGCLCRVRWTGVY